MRAPADARGAGAFAPPLGGVPVLDPALAFDVAALGVDAGAGSFRASHAETHDPQSAKARARRCIERMTNLVV
jgi:hypothetical protein